MILASNPTSNSTRAYDQLVQHGIPVVLLDTLLADREEDFVSVDNRKGTMLAVRHLVELGHRRIGYVGHHDCPDVPCRAERLIGYLNACKQYGLPAPDEWRVETTSEDGPEQIRAMLKSKRRPTGLVTYSDHWAVTVIQAARQAGLRVPEDLSVVGFDRSWFGRSYDVALTTVDPRPADLARAAVRMLIERIEQPEERPKYSLLIAPRMVIRNSTGRVD